MADDGTRRAVTSSSVKGALAKMPPINQSITRARQGEGKAGGVPVTPEMIPSTTGM